MLAGLTKRPLQVLYQSLWRAADLVYPPVCGGCGKLGQRWCPDCQAQVENIHSVNICTKCGIPLTVSGICHHCRQEPPPFQAVRSCAVYQGPLREAIHALKYRGDLGLGETFSHFMLNLLSSENWPIDLVTCVPLSPQRMSERGYNQSSLLARPIALGLGLPYQSHLLERTRDTTSQVKLSRNDRIENMRNAFRANVKTARNRDILVVDDVTTTGATMLGCAQALMQAGANKVYGITLARAVLQYFSNPVQGAPD